MAEAFATGCNQETGGHRGVTGEECRKYTFHTAAFSDRPTFSPLFSAETVATIIVLISPLFNRFLHDGRSTSDPKDLTTPDRLCAGQ